MNRPTIRDIARASNLSETAVSFALNRKPGVSEATRKKVQEVAEQLGWGPHAAALALSGSRAGAVGLVIARPYREVGHEAFFLQLIAGIETVLGPNTLALTLHIVETIEEELKTYQRWWAERRVDGVLTVDLRENDPRPALLKQLGLPAVLAGGPDIQGGMPSASIDDAAAMRQVVAKLAASGCSSIAHVSGLTELSHTRHRMKAFVSAAGEMGLNIVSSTPTDYTERAGHNETASLLALPAPPDGIVYDNEILALGGLNAIAEAGLAVPDDVAVVSWEDSPVCRVASVPLTSLSRDTITLGAHAAEMLIETISGGVPENRIEPVPSLIERASTSTGRRRAET